VRFSPTSETRLFRHPCAPVTDPTEIWYSEEEYIAMGDANDVAVVAVKKRFGRCGAEELDLNGLENLISTKTARKIALRRRQRGRAVVQEHNMQVESVGEYDAECVALASAQYSKWSVRRARVIGLMQAQFADERNRGRHESKGGKLSLPR